MPDISGYIRERVKHEYIENELWEFIGKHLLPLLSCTLLLKPIPNVLTSVLSHYVELLLSVKETRLSEVSCEILLEYILLFIMKHLIPETEVHSHKELSG